MYFGWYNKIGQIIHVQNLSFNDKRKAPQKQLCRVQAIRWPPPDQKPVMWCISHTPRNVHDGRLQFTCSDLKQEEHKFLKSYDLEVLKIVQGMFAWSLGYS